VVAGIARRFRSVEFASFQDCLVEQSGFELSVPLVWGESGRFLAVSVSPSALIGAAEADRGTTGF
jgi:hypothetical protein